MCDGINRALKAPRWNIKRKRNEFDNEKIKNKENDTGNSEKKIRYGSHKIQISECKDRQPHSSWNKHQNKFHNKNRNQSKYKHKNNRTGFNYENYQQRNLGLSKPFTSPKGKGKESHWPKTPDRSIKKLNYYSVSNKFSKNEFSNKICNKLNKAKFTKEDGTIGISLYLEKIKEEKYKIIGLISSSRVVKESFITKAIQNKFKNQIKEVIKETTLIDAPKNVEDIEIHIVDRISENYSLDWYHQLVLKYAKQNDTETIKKEINKIKDMVNNALKKPKIETNKRKLIEFFDLLNGSFNSKIDYKALAAPTKIELERILNDRASTLISDTKLNFEKVKDALYLLFHNQLCVEKNIWYQEKKITEHTFALTEETNPILIAFHHQGKWAEKEKCPSCSAIAKVISNSEVCFPVSNIDTTPAKSSKPTFDPKYSEARVNHLRHEKESKKLFN